MPRSTVVFLFVLAIIASLLGYNYFAQPFADKSEALRDIQDVGEIGAEIVDDTQAELPKATEKDLAQLIAFPYLVEEKASTESTSLAWIAKNNPGAVALFGEKISSSAASLAIKDVTQDLDQKSKPIIVVDHEGGSVQRLSGQGFTVLPSWKSFCALEKEKRNDLLTVSAKELAEVGIEMVFAPVVDIASQSAVLKNRICSADPTVTTLRSQEFIEAFGQQKIFSVIKHFPGIGSVSKDLHHYYDEVEVTEPELEIFQELLSSYPIMGVMSTHVGVKNFYEGQPCSLNRDCVEDLTGNFLTSLIFSDALDMESAGYIAEQDELLPLAERAVAAVLAGNDILVFGPEVTVGEIDLVLITLKKYFREDLLFQEQVETSLNKINRYKDYLRQ